MESSESSFSDVSSCSSASATQDVLIAPSKMSAVPRADSEMKTIDEAVSSLMNKLIRCSSHLTDTQYAFYCRYNTDYLNGEMNRKARKAKKNGVGNTMMTMDDASTDLGSVRIGRPHNRRNARAPSTDSSVVTDHRGKNGTVLQAIEEVQETGELMLHGRPELPTPSTSSVDDDHIDLQAWPDVPASKATPKSASKKKKNVGKKRQNLDESIVSPIAEKQAKTEAKCRSNPDRDERSKKPVDIFRRDPDAGVYDAFSDLGEDYSSSFPGSRSVTPNTLIASFLPDEDTTARYSPPLQDVLNLFSPTSSRRTSSALSSPSSLKNSRVNPVTKRVAKAVEAAKKVDKKKKLPKLAVPDELTDLVESLKPTNHREYNHDESDLDDQF